jgi:hypothetical protein
MLFWNPKARHSNHKSPSHFSPVHVIGGDFFGVCFIIMIGSGWGPVPGCREYDNETSDSIKGGKFLDQLNRTNRFSGMSLLHGVNLVRISFPWGAGLAQSVWRLATGWTAEGSELESQKGQDFSPLHVVQTRSGAHPASCPVGTGGSFSGGKAAGA